MDQVGALTGNKRLKNLTNVFSDIVKRKSFVGGRNNIVERLVEQFKYDAQVFSEYKVILHLNNVLLLELGPSLFLAQFLQDFNLNQTLNGILMLVLYNLDCMHGSSL